MLNRFPAILPLLLALAVLGSAPVAGLWWNGSTDSMASARSEALQETEEVFLSFRYRGVGDQVVIGKYSYDTGRIYLPTTGLFDLLGIFYAVDSRALRVHGHYLSTDRPYEIHFQNRTARLERQTFSFQVEDMLVEELDFYLLPEVFEQVFGLEFSVDMSGLVLRLQTRETMPVVDRMERQLRRQRADMGMRAHVLHPMEFERNRRFLGGGFMDYSFTGNLSDQTQNYSYSTSIGAEALGGDIQGNLFGSWSASSSNFTTTGLRWRYVFEDRPWLTQARLGQYRTEGPQSRSFRGIHLTNQPIEPRRTLDEFVFRGTAPPESEVELFINNRLVDFREVDALGSYQFMVPLTYGSSQVRIMVYEPDGRIREEDRRIQVPFTFLPPGEWNYHLSAGRMDTPIFGQQGYSDLAAGTVSLGVSNWLTARVGGEYLSQVHEDRPFMYGGFSARMFGQYLVNVDAAPEAWYRLSSSVVYSNSTSFSLNYTRFTTRDGLYNIGRYDQEWQASIFFPVNLGPLPLNFRLSGDRQEAGSFSSNRLRGDLGIRLGRINLRGGYRDTYRFSGSELLSRDGRITSTATYSTPRTRSIPALIRGTYLRGQIDYNMRLEQVERVDLQIARSIFRTGRLRFSVGHNLIRDYSTIEGALTFDFNRTRSTSTVRSARNSFGVRQNIRGSVGFDDYHRRLVFENRQQVGRSAASVRLFVDRNNSGTFDEGDELIRVNALRMDRSGTARLHNDGVVRITQVQQYYRNNLLVNVGAIPNPLLVPVVREFSFVADPNRFKPMDIPFYMSGVIDGMVVRQRGERQQGLGGVRVLLRQVDGDYRETLRTFSDGSYYAMEIPPGRYEAWVDSTQQNFLNVHSRPAVRRFEVRALAEGDFLEDLHFVLFSRDVEEELEEIEEELEDIEREHLLVLEDQANRVIRKYVAAQRAFYDLNLEEALQRLEESLMLQETDYGLALMGSLLFLHGQELQAENYWNEASMRNPAIRIPDTDVLKLILETDRDGINFSDRWD